MSAHSGHNPAGHDPAGHTLDPHLLQSLVDAAPEGIAICEARDGDWPVVFVNAAM
jgi:hypothetical protein